jgi:hypothetical protein
MALWSDNRDRTHMRNVARVAALGQYRLDPVGEEGKRGTALLQTATRLEKVRVRSV